MKRRDSWLVSDNCIPYIQWVPNVTIFNEIDRLLSFEIETQLKTLCLVYWRIFSLQRRIYNTWWPHLKQSLGKGLNIGLYNDLDTLASTISFIFCSIAAQFQMQSFRRSIFKCFWWFYLSFCGALFCAKVPITDPYCDGDVGMELACQ